jgi:hypothetical protein
MKAHHFNDPLHMPHTGWLPDQLLAHAEPLPGSAGEAYVERRGVPVAVAAAAGLRFSRDFGGRPAVIVPLCDAADRLTSVHGRYLEVVRGQDKMLTIGPGNGVISVLAGWRARPLIIVEGLFDALSLATCGWPAVATIGRWAAWLPDVSAGRTVWLALDAGRPAEADAVRYAQRLTHAHPRRILPPPRCKDWNTALRKGGQAALTRWLQQQVIDDTTSGDAGNRAHQ